MNYDHLSLQENNCLVCNESDAKVLGVRGNREYHGSDPKAHPHFQTNVMKCLNCNFIYINPLIVGADLLEKEHYSSSESYKTAANSDIMKMFSKRIQLISKFKSTGKLLDVGSGRGEFLSVCSQNGFEVEGVEPSNGLASYSVDTYNLDIKNGIISDLNEDSTFDIITLNHVLEHVEDPKQMLKEISIRLSEDGLLFMEVPNTESLFLKIIDFYYRIKKLNWSSRLSPLHPPFHKFGYNKKSMRFILNNNGFEVVKIGTFSGNDRGIEDKPTKTIIKIIRSIITFSLNIIGNRELLYVLAIKKAN